MKTPASGWLRIGGPKARRTLVAAAMVAGVIQLSPGASFATQFCNTTPITGTGGTGPSSPYPSSITVSGLTGTITDVNVTLFGIRTRGDNNSPPEHWIEDADIMVSGPTGANVILMSDAGGDNDVSQGPVVNTDLTFDDQAANQLPADTHFSSGTYRPVDDDNDVGEAQPVDSWDAPAPTPSNSTTLSTFNGLSPNGTWNLWAVDDTTQAPFDILGGWCIDILTTGGGGTTTTTGGGGTTTTSSTTTTVAPTTTTSSTTTTTVAPTTTTSSSTTTTTRPSTTTSSTTTTTVAPTTTTSSTTTTTVAPTTTTSSSTTTTVAPTTTTSSSTTTTVAQPTTSTTRVSTTTSTTQVSGNTCTAQLLMRRAQINSQVDATRASLVQFVPAEQRATYLARLEASRSAANAQIDQALARCPA